MAKPEIPEVITVTGSVGSTDVDTNATEVILRARSSNVQAICVNISTGAGASDDPTGSGGKAIVLFPGESIVLAIDTVPSGHDYKYIIFNDDTTLADPVLEIIEVT